MQKVIIIYFFFQMCLLPVYVFWMNLLCFCIWYEVKVKVFFVTDSYSLSITYIEFKSSFLYFLWIFREMAIAHYWFTSCVNRLKYVQKYTCNCNLVITHINIIVNNYHDQNMMKYKFVIIFITLLEKQPNWL